MLYPLSYEGYVDSSNQNLDGKKLLEPAFVEADDELIAYRNDRHTHLSALFYHLLSLRKIRRDVVIRELNTMSGKEFLCHVTEVARGGGINRYFFLCSHTLYEMDALDK